MRCLWAIRGVTSTDRLQNREDIFTLETITVDSGGLDTFAAWKEIITSLGMHTNKTSTGLILGSRY